jgi:addiction module HigA family antidote
MIDAETNGETSMSGPLVHPGEILAGELKEIGVAPSELARQIEVPANRISEIIRGRRGITGDTALRLGHWFGTAPQFWINLQSAYDLRLAAEQAGPAIEKLRRRIDPPPPSRQARLDLEPQERQEKASAGPGAIDGN